MARDERARGDRMDGTVRPRRDEVGDTAKNHPPQSYATVIDPEMAHAELRAADEELRIQQREIEDLLRSHRNRQWQHERLLGLLPTPVITTDAYGVIATVNSSAASLLGMRIDRLLRKPIQVFVAETDRSALRHDLSRCVRQESTFRRVVTMCPRHGSPVAVELIVAAGRDQVSATEVTWLLMNPTEASGGREPGGRDSMVLALSELTLIPVHTVDPWQTAHRMASVSQEALGTGSSVTVAVGDPLQPEVVASTSKRAQQLDWMQLRCEEGPSASAGRSGKVVRSDDLVHDPRWADLGESTDLTEEHNVVSAPLVIGDEVIGVLTAYDVEPAHLDPDDDVVELLATATAAVAHEMRVKAELHELTENLRTAIGSRSVIDQAKGIIMARRHCTADEAFDVLAQMSMTRNRKLRLVARDIVDAASAPSHDGAGRGRDA
ncbi:putative PAS/PAC sensor protein [Nostocoides japonicum T1-X7]|uniref:Putative PAS/PAC sensor protein n=1 Tax=Nostocoides japonicum T1-X7 TaxID=1194083 RepID=A0A077M5L4_9MICO|nr:ANTAR domain-containing protein [Tetrasphaera japonica]CCH79340.1 putative PAS/PAC sensor protein [Tetrasphaera japonica T1-X7]